MSVPNSSPTSFDVPGFVSEQRPEIQQLRAVERGAKRPVFFARSRHDAPNLGLLEPTPLADQVMVSVELRPFQPIHVFCDGRHMRKPASRPGVLALYDLRKSWIADIRDPFDTLHVFLPLRSLQDYAAERGGSFCSLRYDVREVCYDDVMLHLMQAMLPALERPREIDTLYLESLFLAVRDHIGATYGNFRKEPLRKQYGLTARQLRHALEFMEANLGSDFGLTQIASACAASVSSLTRGFRASLGTSPHRWVLTRRIARAQRLIYEGAMPLSEVAACCGFADQSHLTRQFQRQVGSSPAAWRRQTRA
ncbi:MAG: AraC family transcriptional regulator [Acidobacteriota bacterium]|nr:AraC family transcriptional regulator [Acidobacteriota bacterium]